MRIAIVSDIHSNLPAFESVLRDAEREGPLDAVWSLGDLVGYGPHPNECIALLRRYQHVNVAGNHDLAACGRMGTEEFNAAAATAAQWTNEQLTPDSRNYLEELPQTVTEHDFAFAHGSLREPVWEYLLSGEQALVQFELQPTPYSAVGHSHLPFVCREEPGATPQLRPASDGECVELRDERLIVNPGSVGQPRDGDPRAGYALLENGTLTFRRIEYDIAATQRAMDGADLPVWLIERLSVGR